MSELNEWEVIDAIENKNSKLLFEVLLNILNRLERLENSFHHDKMKINAMKNILSTLEYATELAEDYPSVKSKLDYKDRLYDIARNFIIDKHLDGEFNLVANEKMKST